MVKKMKISYETTEDKGDSEKIKQGDGIYCQNKREIEKQYGKALMLHNSYPNSVVSVIAHNGIAMMFVHENCGFDICIEDKIQKAFPNISSNNPLIQEFYPGDRQP
jgi:hypothetical protein